MKVFYLSCAFFAAIFAILAVALAITALLGDSFNILLPGLGLVITVWGVIIVLGFMALVFFVLALIFKKLSAKNIYL